MFSKFTYLFVFLILVESYTCQDESSGGTEIKIPASAALSLETTINTILGQDYHILLQLLNQRANQPVPSGMIEAVLRALEIIVKAIQKYGVLLSETMRASLDIGAVTVGGVVDDFSHGLFTIPGSVACRLSKLPLVGGMFGNMDNKVKTCHIETPETVFTDVMVQGVGCINRNLNEITGHIFDIQTNWIGVCLEITRVLNENKNIPLNKIPGAAKEIIKNEFAGPLPAIFKNLKESFGFLIKLAPGIATCYIKTILPAIKVKISLLFNRLKCMISDISNAGRLNKEAEDLLINFKKGLQENSI